MVSTAATATAAALLSNFIENLCTSEFDSFKWLLFIGMNLLKDGYSMILMKFVVNWLMWFIGNFECKTKHTIV